MDDFKLIHDYYILTSSLIAPQNWDVGMLKYFYKMLALLLLLLLLLSTRASTHLRPCLATGLRKGRGQGAGKGWKPKSPMIVDWKPTNFGDLGLRNSLPNSGIQHFKCFFSSEKVDDSHFVGWIQTLLDFTGSQTWPGKFGGKRLESNRPRFFVDLVRNLAGDISESRHIVSYLWFTWCTFLFV